MQSLDVGERTSISGRKWYNKRSLQPLYLRETPTGMSQYGHKCWNLHEALDTCLENKAKTLLPRMEMTGTYYGPATVAPAQHLGPANDMSYPSTPPSFHQRLEYRLVHLICHAGKQPEQTSRVIYPAYGGTCTASYAISLRGARKALYRLSMQPNNHPVDLGLRTLCQDKDFGFKCVAPFPTIVGMYRPAGNSSSHSDIETYDGIAEEGTANGLMFSTRMNIDRLLKSETTFKSSFPDVTGEEMSIEDITSAVGHHEIVPLNPKYQDLSNEELKQIPWDSEEGAVE